MINRIGVLWLLVTFIVHINSENEVDFKWCYSEGHSHLENCECKEENLPPWGDRTLTIDCGYRNLQNSDIDSFGEVLPLYTHTLDVSWNQLTNLPSFNGYSLRRLIASNNNLTRINEKNFVDVPSLNELDLSWNSINILSLNAFYKLDKLTKLSLAHNNIKMIPNGVFFYLSSLESINLSWNVNLHEQKDLITNNIFFQFGLNMKLKELKLDKCNLDGLDLTSSTSLEVLSLRSNNFKTIPNTIKTLKYLDMSENPIDSLQPLNNLTNVETLYLEDMNRLYGFNNEEFPLFGRKLKFLSLQNSRKLHRFIISNSSDFSSLEILNLRGTMVRTFNQTMEPMFQKLKEVNLNGIPFTCECDLVWIKRLPLETSAQCYKPSKIHGMKFSSVREEDFGCDPWPNWVYGILIFVLIVLCSIGIWLVVMGLRPYGRNSVQIRGNNRLSSSSPYARVTIEPSRADKSLF
ncbi:hypothetical protein ACFFRR_008108 [Megaselia abdita]